MFQVQSIQVVTPPKDPFIILVSAIAKNQNRTDFAWSLASERDEQQFRKLTLALEEHLLGKSTPWRVYCCYCYLEKKNESGARDRPRDRRLGAIFVIVIGRDL